MDISGQVLWLTKLLSVRVTYFITSLDPICKVVSKGIMLWAGWSRVHNPVWTRFLFTNIFRPALVPPGRLLKG